MKSLRTGNSLPKSGSSGTVTSIRRQWSSSGLHAPVSPPPQSQLPPSSQPSWQATESDWPPSSPPKPKPKPKPKTNPNLTAPFTNPVKTSAGAVTGQFTIDSGAPKTVLDAPDASSTSRAPLTNKTIRTNSGFQANPSVTHLIAQRTPSNTKPSAKRDLPWEITAPNAKKPALASSRVSTASIDASKQPLGKPNLSIAAKVILSKEQQAVLDSVLKGQSVFFTGSAGTGKSVLLRHIITALRSLHGRSKDGVVVTASTGMAACAIGGTTIHSFAGIGLGIEAPDFLVSKVRKNRKAASRWARTKVLIIDEISMVDGELFDKLAYIAQQLRRSQKPFGGIQLVIAGDFFQLPPVSKGKVAFAFNAKRWKECISQTVNLSQVFRQKDTTFIDMLNEMRLGALSDQSVRKFRELSREIKYDDGIMPTELYPTRQEVERSNTTRLNALKEEPITYTAHDSGRGTPEQKARDFVNMMAVERLVLKKGAQVMMIKNQSSEEGPSWLVNGIVGKIESFVDITPNMGNTGENGEDGGGSAFPPVRGSKAVAGSKSPAPKVAKTQLPYVAWRLPTGRIERTVVDPAEFKVENADGELQSKRVQLPLILAWAMSIHKSQGQTLTRVKVDLGKVFEKGQIYVALSRATSLEGLQVLRFDPKKVMAHPEVVEWSRNLLSLT